MALKPFTNEQLNFFKFSTLVLDEFPKVLREIFITMWNSKIAPRPGFITWDDSAQVRNMLLTSEGGKTDIPTVKSIEEWDCTALFKATIYAKTFGGPGGIGSTLNDLYLKKMKPVPGSFHPSVESSTGNKDETYALAIDQLRLLRNRLCHSPKSEITKSDFDHYVHLVISALSAVNVNTSFVDGISQLNEDDFPTAKVEELNERRLKELQAITLFHEELDQKLSSIDERTANIETMVGNMNLSSRRSVSDSLPKPHIPSPVPFFTGRQVEIKEIAILITGQSTRLLNIWGSPGFGKTSTAIEAAHHLLSLGNPVYFFKFQGTKTIDECLSQILSIFKSSVVDLGLTPVDRLVSIFREISSPIYLIFDNLDDLLSNEANGGESLFRLLDKFLDSSSAINIIFTTREQLDTTHAQGKSVRIRALNESSSINYVRQLIPSFSETIFVKVARICSYVPLAMKLVSSLLGNSSEEIATKILEELNLSGNLLQQFDSPHESNLQKLFDTLFEQLTSADKRTLVSLAVFSPAIISHGAATDVALGVSLLMSKAVASLKTLLKKSLIDEDPDGKYYAIHPLIYSFIVGKGKQQDFQNVAKSSVNRFCKYYLGLFEGFNDDFLAGKLVDSPKLQDTILHLPNAVRLIFNSDAENIQDLYNVLSKSEMFLFLIDVPFWQTMDVRELYHSAIEKCRAEYNNSGCLKLYVSRYVGSVVFSLFYRSNGNVEIPEDVRKEVMLLPDGTAAKLSCCEGIRLIFQGNKKSGILLIRENYDSLQNHSDQQLLKCLCLQLLALLHSDSEQRVYKKKAVEVCEEIGNHHLFLIDECGRALPSAKQGDLCETLILFAYVLSVWSRTFLDSDRKAHFLNFVTISQQKKENSGFGGYYSSRILFYGDCILAVLGFETGKGYLLDKTITSLYQSLADSTSAVPGPYNAMLNQLHLSDRLFSCYMFKIKCQGQKERGQSIETCQRVLDLSLKQHGKEHKATAICYFEIGKAEHADENYRPALDAFNVSLEIYTAIREANSSDDEFVAGLYIGKGETYQAMNKFQNAIACFEKALEIRRKLIDQDLEKIAEVLALLASTQFHSKDLPGALLSSTEALETILKLFPAKPYLYALLVDLHVTIAHVHFGLGNQADGISHLKNVLEIDTDREQERIVFQSFICMRLLEFETSGTLYMEKLNRILPALKEYSIFFWSNAVLVISSHQLQLGNLKAAFTSLQNVLDIEVGVTLRQDVFLREWIVSYCLQKVLMVPEVLKPNNFSLAKKVSDRVIEIAESLPELKRNCWVRRYYLCKGYLYYENEKYQLAIKFFDLSLSQLPNEGTTFGNVQGLERNELFCCYMLKASAQLFQHDYRDALGSAYEALSIKKKLCPEGSYEEACAYSLVAQIAEKMKNRELAVNNLRLAYKMSSRVLGANHFTSQQLYLNYARALVTS